MGKKITIEPVTRVEGHGKVTINLGDSGDVEQTGQHDPAMFQFLVTQVPKQAARFWVTGEVLSHGLIDPRDPELEQRRALIGIANRPGYRDRMGLVVLDDPFEQGLPLVEQQAEEDPEAEQANDLGRMAQAVVSVDHGLHTSTSALW